MKNFNACLPIVLRHEGGFTKNPNDPGNWTGGAKGIGELKGTKFGISAASFPHLDIENLSVTQAGKIYREKYWDAIGGDSMPNGLDLTTFDAAVNSGVSRAKRWYQAARVQDVVDSIKRYNANRRSFLRNLTTFKHFGTGWMRRVADIEAKSVKMALQAQGMVETAIADRMRAEGAKADTKSQQSARGAGSSGAGAGGVAVAAPATDITVYLVALGIVAAVAGVLLYVRHRQHKARKEAFLAEV